MSTERRWALVSVNDKCGQRPRAWHFGLLRTYTMRGLAFDRWLRAGSPPNMEVIEVTPRSGDRAMWIQVGTEPDPAGGVK